MPILKFEHGSAVYQSPYAQEIYPTFALPELVRNAVLEVSQKLHVSGEIATHAALAAMSLACQNLVDVQCPGFPAMPCALFLLTVSDSSGGKSLMEARFWRAIREFERKSAEAAAARLPDYRAEMKIWSDDQRRLSKEYRDAKPGTEASRLIREQRIAHEKNQPVKPTARELRFAEISPQGLRDALIANGAVGILSPEAEPALSGMTFSQPAMLSGYWSGDDRPVGLVSGNRRAVNPRLSVAVMLQENQFHKYMELRGDDAFGTGLLARMLPAFPRTMDYRGQQTGTGHQPEPVLDLFNERIASLLDRPVPEPDARPVLQLSDDAGHYWKLFREAVHDRLVCGSFSKNVTSFFRKLGEQAARIAALFHYVQGAPGDVSPDAMISAIRLCEWYAHEVVRVFSVFAPSQQQLQNEVAEKLFAWLQQTFANPLRYSRLHVGRYSERDLSNYSNIRNDPEKLAMAIDVLQQQGRIATGYGKKGGRIVFYPPYMAQQYYPPTIYAPRVNQGMFDPYPASPHGSNWPATQNNGSGNFNGRNPVQGGNMQSHSPVPPVVNPGTATGIANQDYHGSPVQAQIVQEDDGAMRWELDSPELRAVKAHAQKAAIEAGIGNVDMTMTYRQG